MVDPSASQASVEPPILIGISGGSRRGVAPSAASTRHNASLTPRQQQIFDMVLEGHPSKNIAAELGISQRTVENHRQSIMKKMHAKSLPELVRLALAANLLSAADPFGVDDKLSLPWDVETIMAVARAMFKNATAAIAMTDGAGFILHLNPAGELLLGYFEADLLGKPIEMILPGALNDQNTKSREEQMQKPAMCPNGGGRGLTARHMDGHEISVDIKRIPLDAGGRPTITLFYIIDNSSRERTERAELFIQELTHRARNMLALILAISRQISRASNDIDTFESAFEQRLSSFAATYRVFECGETHNASISDLVHSQLSLLLGNSMQQIQMVGPDFQLPPRLAEPLGLAIHELATNAIKHGALSLPGGAVNVRWAADPKAGVFQFDWTEHRGPAIGEPTRKGFGSVILKQVVPSAFRGVGSLLSTPDGFAWHLEAPLVAMPESVGRRRGTSLSRPDLADFVAGQ